MSVKKLIFSFIFIIILAFPCFAQKAELVVQSGTYHSAQILFAPEGKILALAATRGITLIDVKTWKEFRHFSAFTIDKMAFSQDEKYLGCSEKDEKSPFMKNIKFFEIATGNEVYSIDNKKYSVLLKYLNEKSEINPFLPNFISKIEIVADTTKGLIIAYDPKTRKKIKELKPENFFEAVQSLSLTPDGKFLVIAFASCVRIYNFESGKQVKYLRNILDIPFYFSKNTIDNSLKALMNFGIYNWDLTKGKSSKILKFKYLWDKKNNINPSIKEIDNPQLRYPESIIKVSPDGNKLFFNDAYSQKLFDTDLNVLPFVNEKGIPKSTSFSDNGNIFASGITFYQNPKDGKYILSENFISIWDLKNNVKVNTIKGHSDEISSLVFSDNKVLISGSKDKTIRFWNIYSGKEIGNIEEKGQIKALAVDKNKRYLAVSVKLTDDFINFDSSIDIFDLKSLKKLRTLPVEDNIINSLSFSTDGKLLVAGGYMSLSKSNIKIFDTASWNEVNSFKGLSPVYFSNDSKNVFFQGTDKTIKIRDIKTNKNIASLVSTFYPEGFAISTEDNYYMASRNGLNAVAFRIGNKAFPFEQFDLKYNRPDLVISKLGYAPKSLINAYHKAYQKRLRKMNFTESMLSEDFHIPEMEILTKNIPLFTDNRKMKLMIKAKDDKYFLDRINVYVNDVPMFGVSGINLRNYKKMKMKGEVTIELSNGKNKIQFSTLNQKGAESLKETIEINYTGEIRKPELYILAVGVSDYGNPDYNLQYASKDAGDIANFFKKSFHGNVKVKTILDREATKKNILKAKEFLSKSNVDDKVIVFFAGHGMVDDKLDYYFASTDIDFRNPSKNGINYDEIEFLLDNIPSRNKLLLIDSCNSGEVDKDDIGNFKISSNKAVKTRAIRGIKVKSKLGIGNLSDLLNELFTDLRRSSGTTVISASGGLEYSYEGDKWENGVFTYSVLEGLESKNADLDRNGLLSISELKEYVTEEVQNLTNGKQTPNSRNENVENDFYIFDDSKFPILK